MQAILGNAKTTLMNSHGLDPSKDDIGLLLVELIPTWSSWYYNEDFDILTVDFNIVLSPRVSELGELINNDITIG